jgi:KipI family sensor histidine kinase inhibitor
VSRVLPYGESALLVETDAPLGLWDVAARLPGVVETVPAARTVLVRFDPAATDARSLSAAIATLEPAGPPPAPGPSVELVVRYDGADLGAVAAQTGLGVDEVITRHAGVEYTVGFCGFSPGFSYLTGLDPALHLPRLATPRTSVPAGSVAIAGTYTGVYPRSSPGGWRLLGTTDADLWDAGREQPALLRPGARVRFRPT